LTPTVVTATDAGKICPYCRFPLKTGSDAERCGGCQTIHHLECWGEGGGCAMFGCSNAGDAVDTAGPMSGAHGGTASCAHCGQAVSWSARFCSACGTTLDVGDPERNIDRAIDAYEDGSFQPALAMLVEEVEAAVHREDTATVVRIVEVGRAMAGHLAEGDNVRIEIEELVVSAAKGFNRIDARPPSPLLAQAKTSFADDDLVGAVELIHQEAVAGALDGDRLVRALCLAEELRDDIEWSERRPFDYVIEAIARKLAP
jgi:Prokaryotic RING finger family 1